MHRIIFQLRSALAVAALLFPIMLPTGALALTYNMPSPGGAASMVLAFPGTAWQNHYIVFKAANGACTWTNLGTEQPNEDITINGTSGADAFYDYKIGNDGNYPMICEGIPVSSSRPLGSHTLNINLGGGNDVAFVNNFTNIHGGSGNDFLRNTNVNQHDQGGYWGDDGADYVYAGAALGGAGDDVLCSAREDQRDQYLADGGSGTDTFCGGDVWSGRLTSVEHYRDSRCPAACRGLLGW